MSLKYSDGDGDLITLSSQNDLDNLLIFAGTRSTIDVFVSELLQLPDIKRTTHTARYPSTSTTASPAVAITKMPIIPPLFPAMSSAASSLGSKDTTIKWKRGEVVGQGAFGVVYLGLNTESGELMAVKQMALEEVSTKELSSLENEINLLRSLRHPNIVRYIGTEITPASLSIFLEYIPGGSLKSLIEKFGSLEENVVRSYTRQLLLGLEYLHRNGIAHRDIKGANCLVSNDGVVKLADFGASKHWRPTAVAGSSVQSNKSGDIKGTPSWMAPELIKEQGGAISWRKADVWSIACTTLEMTTGQPPWAQFNNHVTVLYHLACTDALPEYPSSASIELVTFLNICLQRDPARRPDITSLLLHPFVSGAGWSQAAVARPSTVSTTPAWAWANQNSARDPPLTALRPTNAIEAPLTSRESSKATRDLKPFTSSLEEVVYKKSVIVSSRDAMELTGFSSAVSEVGSYKDLSDGESTVASVSSKRLLRSKAKANKGKKAGGMSRRGAERKVVLETDLQGSLLVNDNDSVDAQLEESKDSVEWAKEGSDDEILEEIEESFEDSLELVEMSTSTVEGAFNKPQLVQSASFDELSIDLGTEAAEEKAGADVWKADAKPAGSVSRLKNAKASAQQVKGQGQGTLKERRQWGGNLDVIRPSASSSFMDLGRESPSDLNSAYTFKVPPSSKGNSQRAQGFASTPSSAQEKGKRIRTGQSLRTGTASIELDVSSDLAARAVTSSSATYYAEEAEDERKEDAGERSRLSFAALDGSSVQILSEHQGAVTKLFAPKRANVLISSSTDGTIRLWDNSSLESRCVLDTAAFNAMAAGVDSSVTAESLPRRSIGRPAPEEKVANAPPALLNPIAIKVTHLWAEEQCETIWGGCADYNIRVWNGADGKPLRFLKGHDDQITCMDGISGGVVQNVTFVASGSVDRTIRVYDVRSKKPVVFLFRGHTDSVLTVKMAEGGRTIISGSKDKTVKLFDTRTGRMRVSLEKHFGAVSCLRVVPDLMPGKGADGAGFISGGRDSMMNIWNMNGDVIATQPAHRGSLNRISNVTDGASPMFFTCGADAIVKQWDLRRMKLMSEVRTGAVSDLLCQPNALVTSSTAGLMKLWTTTSLPSSAAEGKSSKEWNGCDLAQHSTTCTDLVAGSDFIASSSKAGQIYRWILSN